MRELAMDHQNFCETVAAFFNFLEAIEETDSGKPFHPITLSSCRVILTPKVNDVLQEMRHYLQERDYLGPRYTLEDYRKDREID